MAVIRTTDNVFKELKPEQAMDLWKLLNGEIEGSPAQQKFASKVQSVYLNWRTAPDLYLVRNAEVLREIVLNNWMVDRGGNYTRPEFSDETVWRVSKVLGLLENGKPTKYVHDVNAGKRAVNVFGSAA